jgi:hypothetical protein
MSDKDLINDFTEAYKTAEEKWGPWWAASGKDLEFKMGRQWSAKDRAYLKIQDRDALVWNKVRRQVHIVSGYQRKNRLAMRVEPTEGDPMTAMILSECLQWNLTYENTYFLLSKAFENGPLTTGLNLIELWIDYSKDPLSGDIKFSRVAHNQIMLDPFFTEQDLSDCTYMLRRRWVSRHQAKALLPGKSRAIDGIKPKGPDKKFPESPPSKDWKGKNILKLDQFYRQDSRKIKYVLNRITGQFIKWSGSTRQLDDMMNSPSPAGDNWGVILKIINQYETYVKVGYILEDENFYDDVDPTGLDDYPFVPLLGYWEPEYKDLEWKLQGLVRCLRDPATEANRRRVKMLDILDSQYLGIKAKAKSVVDKAAPYQTGQGSVTWMTDNADMNDVQPMMGPSVPAGTIEAAKLMDEDLNDVIGMSGELSAMPEPGENVNSFIHAKLREANGIMVYQPLLDPYRDSKKNLGQKMIQIIQANWSPEKVFRVTHKQPTPEFFKKNFGKYDCTVSEGALTDSQKKMRYGELLALKGQQAPIPWSMVLSMSALEVAPELIQSIQKQEGMQQQITMMKLQVDIVREKAKAALDSAKADATKSKSGLDRVKAMEEIASMHDEKLMDLLKLAIEIEARGGSGLPGQEEMMGGRMPVRGKTKLLPAPQPQAQPQQQEPSPEEMNWQTIGGDDLG